MGLSAGSSGNMVRILGESAHITAGSTSLVKGSAFEYVIPETAWETAPFRVTDNFTIPADFTLRLDEAALMAYRERMKAQGVSRVTMPLMQAKTNAGVAKTITIADMTALSANLPDGCSLVNQSGVLSLKVKSGNGFIISFR